MALQTANQYRLVADASPLAAAVSEMMTARRASQKDEALRLAEAAKGRASQFLHLRSLADGANSQEARMSAYQTQKKELANLATRMAQNNEDLSLVDEGMKITDPTELNTFFSSVAAKYLDPAKQLEKELGLGDKAKTQFGGQVLYKDSDDNYFYGTTSRDPTDSTVKSSLVSADPDQPDLKPSGKLERVNQLGQTRSQKIEDTVSTTDQTERIKTTQELIRKRDALTAELEFKPDIAREVELQKINATLASDAFSQARKLQLSEKSYNRAIELVRKDPSITGPIDSMWPSFSAAAIELDNIQQSLGLDLISMGSFGPLNTEELKLALETVLPPLDGPELVTWLEDQRDAKLALATELRKYAIHLSRGGTQEEYLAANPPKKQTGNLTPEEQAELETLQREKEEGLF